MRTFIIIVLTVIATALQVSAQDAQKKEEPFSRDPRAIGDPGRPIVPNLNPPDAQKKEDPFNIGHVGRSVGGIWDAIINVLPNAQKKE